MEKIKVFESFSGIGTQHMALKRLGIEFEIVAISEISEDAIKSYEAIHGATNNLGDITEINPETVPDHDLFTYSFPCTDISNEGDKKGMEEGSGTRSSLLWEAMKIVKHKNPKYLVAENVKNLISIRNKSAFDRWIQYLTEIGYNTYYQVINAKGYVPQNRERVFIVSIRKDIDDKSFKFPSKADTNSILLDVLENSPVPEKYIVKDNVKEKIIWKADGQPIVGEAIKIRNATKQGYILAEHGDGIELAFPSSTTRRGRVQKSRGQTLTTSASLGILLVDNGSFEIRRLTPLEYWRLMDIKDEDFRKAEKVVGETALYEQAGNAIVVGILEDIFRSLLTSANVNDIV